MAAAPTKQTQLAALQTLLKKKVPAPESPASERTVLEETLYAILREGADPEQADTAYAKLRDTFFDLNEVRVSSVQEIADAIHGLPGAGAKAERIVGLLQEVFEELYSFDLGDIAKKGVKQAAKQLARYKGGVTDYTVAWVTQRKLGGHAVPLDHPALRLMFRFGIFEAEVEAEEIESARGTVEHYISKATGADFTDRLSPVSVHICLEENPLCPECPLRSDCPTGQARLAAMKAKEKEKEAKAKKGK